jgi:two-component system NarL family response regulator
MERRAPARDRVERVSTTTEILTVLVADDSALYRAGMVRAVSANAELDLVAEAAGGEAALAAIAETRPDVALIDVRMPGVDGLEVCRRLRALDPPLRTRVVLLTSHLTDSVVRRAGEVGAAASLRKPVARRYICWVAIRIPRAG